MNRMAWSTMTTDSSLIITISLCLKLNDISLRLRMNMKIQEFPYQHLTYQRQSDH